MSIFKSNIFRFTVLAVVGFGVGYVALPIVSSRLNAAAAQIANGNAASEKLAQFQAQEDRDAKLGQYVLNMMAAVRTDLSDTRKQILAHSIVNVANEIFPSEDHKRAFITLIAIESRFKRDAKSPAGAVGLTQVIPMYANDHGRTCNLSDIKAEDLLDSDISLMVGACGFRQLIALHGGDIHVALAAYNAGSNSKTVKVYAVAGDMDNRETLKYITKFVFLKDKTSDVKAPAENAKKKPAR